MNDVVSPSGTATHTIQLYGIYSHKQLCGSSDLILYCCMSLFSYCLCLSMTCSVLQGVPLVDYIHLILVLETRL